jgi:hypothetical protein
MSKKEHRMPTTSWIRTDALGEAVEHSSLESLVGAKARLVAHSTTELTSWSEQRFQKRVSDPATVAFTKTRCRRFGSCTSGRTGAIPFLHKLAES